MTAQFENSDGSISEYKGLEVVYSDEDVDFAVISVPAGFSRKGLPFAANTVEDGEDVWSAGFPGLDGKPMWQLGKGNVTNSMARLDELLDSKISTLIQHSAQIDGGNSGGNWKLLEYSAISSTLEMPKSIVANPYKFRGSGAYTFQITGDSSSGFQIEASYTTNFFYYGAGSQAHSAVS